ncbi:MULTISPECIES: hypothetical protein [Pectobacterium]|uniref:hypothetical protein n=1 Tax=Pectobacterium TaxID=122277 RepID=UPI0010FEC86E|nr:MULTISPECIES: hypothetical protein [Pectobacterium]KAA3667406.1 hypothetical protein FEV48_12965 [Pectobacterium carotovorum subsp. carotovorum]MCA6925186.1 hypothetical protein [Pectobacterium versatile]MCH5081946.1 hypothetical protein [Pectobacterium versatile]
MFDISQFNTSLGLFFLISSSLILFFLFKKSVHSIIDPLMLKLVWLSAHISMLLLIGIEQPKYVDEVYWGFWVVVVTYIFLVKLFIPPISGKMPPAIPEKQQPLISFSKMALVLATVGFLISKKPFFDFISENPDPSAWFTFRYAIDFKGRDPILRITELGCIPFIYFYSCYLVLREKKLVLPLVCILITISLNLVSGGKSAILEVANYFGFFFVIYSGFLSNKLLRRVNFLGVFVIAISVVGATYVLSQINEEGIDGAIQAFLNRVFANADGMTYAIKGDIYSNLDSGIIAYFESLFGIYIKYITGINYKNVGWQLTELITGYNLDFAQGSNYTIFIQSYILGLGWSIILLLPIMAYVYGLCRRRKAYFSNNSPFVFAIYSCLVYIYVDAELNILRIISITIIWSVFFIIRKILGSFYLKRNRYRGFQYHGKN